MMKKSLRTTHAYPRYRARTLAMRSWMCSGVVRLSVICPAVGKAAGHAMAKKQEEWLML